MTPESDMFLSKMFSLTGRVGIVTGGSRGIGAALANGLARAGARIYALGRSSRSQDSLVDGVTYRSMDVCDDTGFDALCDEIFAQHQRLDILINAAGVTLPNPSGVQSLADFDKTLAIDLRAPFACSMAAAERMKRTGGGSIVNVTSIGSVLGFPGNPAYVTAKGGLRMMTKALAVDLAAANIRVNALAPGYIRTQMTEGSYNEPRLRQQRQDRMILPRWGQPDDLVGAAIFLAGDASAYVTGQDIFVDGGWTSKGLG